jgi:hypothetical protein
VPIKQSKNLLQQTSPGKEKKITSTNTQQQSLTEKCKSKVKELLQDTNTSSLSLHMPTCPMKEQ